MDTASAAPISLRSFMLHLSHQSETAKTQIGLWVGFTSLDEKELGRRLRGSAQKRLRCCAASRTRGRDFEAAKSSIRNIVNSNSTSWRDLVENLFQVLRLRALALPISDKN